MRLALTLLALLLAAPASAQIASPWQGTPRASARLVADPGLRDGVYHAGAQIRLAPKIITYWRNPGEAGVPPQFDFSASTNLENAEVLYPAPRRIAEAGGVEAFGYEDAVIFPIRVTPKDASQPVHLDMALKYAACDRICVPAEAVGSVDFVPGKSGTAGAELAQAEREVPRKSLVPPMIAPASRADGKPAWKITAPSALPQAGDMFAEGSEGWYFNTRPGAQKTEFELTLTDAPKGADLSAIPVLLTFAGDNAAIEVAVTLGPIAR